MSSDKRRRMAMGANPELEVNEQGTPVVRGTGIMPRLQRALELGESSFPDLEEQERKDAMQKLVEAKMQKRMQEGDRAPASVGPRPESDEMRRARLFHKRTMSPSEEQMLMKQQPRTYELLRRLRQGIDVE